MSLRGQSTGPWPAGWGEARERTVQWHDPTIAARAQPSMTGLDFLRAIVDGRLPPPPIAALLGMRLVEAEVGRVVFECRPEEYHYNPAGMVHGGLACTLVDSAAACAVQTTLPEGMAFTSIELSVSYLRPVTVESGLLRAVGQVTKPGRRVAFATAEVTDATGQAVATATSSCLVMDAGPA